MAGPPARIPMQKLKEALDDVVRQTTWVNRERIVDAVGLRQEYRQTAFSRDLAVVPYNYAPRTPDEQLAELAVRLRPLLGGSLDVSQDRIGNGLFALTGGFGHMEQPTVTEFSRALVKPATLLGSKRVADLVARWSRGEPIHFRANAVIHGITFSGNEMQVEQGVRLWKLPRSSGELPLSSPPDIVTHLGRVVLSFAWELSPAFYRPDKPTSYDGHNRPTRTPVAETVPKPTCDAFCESLSLACNHYVDWRIAWTDLNELGELQAFSDVINGPTRRVVVFRPLGAATVSPDTLAQACEIHSIRHTNGAHEKGLTLAIKWWVESKGSNSYEDRAIRLRVALEALYLGDANTELRYRLASRGAWDLGVGVAERREYFRTLKRFYDLASRVIHVDRKEAPPPDSDAVLSAAQDLCRDGIVKRLRERREPVWDELVLGNDP